MQGPQLHVGQGLLMAETMLQDSCCARLDCKHAVSWRKECSSCIKHVKAHTDIFAPIQPFHYPQG